MEPRPGSRVALVLESALGIGIGIAIVVVSLRGCSVENENGYEYDNEAEYEYDHEHEHEDARGSNSTDPTTGQRSLASNRISMIPSFGASGPDRMLDVRWPRSLPTAGRMGRARRGRRSPVRCSRLLNS